MNIDRRNFLSMTTTLGALAITPFENLVASKPVFRVPAGFSLKVMATNWGFPGSLDVFCAKAKENGYDGIEVWWPGDEKGQTELFAALKKYKLDVGFLCGVAETDHVKHIAAFKQMVNSAARQSIHRPLYINCHSGRDHFPLDINSEMIRHTIELAGETGLIICHETHRSRILFAAHIARQYIERFPGMRITLDVSHWCNVHESLLHDQEDTMQLALARVDHIHARIGHTEGPQVNDPRAPEWESTVKRHLEWWDKIVEMKSRSASRSLTILTEFGPPDYMPALPYTRQPLADQWAINVYMMQLLKKRYLP